MARDVKVFSMSFLDLLCCAMGAVILLSLLLVVDAGEDAAASLDFTYVVAEAKVWVDVSPLLSASQMSADDLPEFVDVEIELHHAPLPQAGSTVAPTLSNLVFRTHPELPEQVDLPQAELFQWWKTRPRTTRRLRLASWSESEPELFSSLPGPPLQVLEFELGLGALRVEPGVYFFSVYMSKGSTLFPQEKPRMFMRLDVQATGPVGRQLFLSEQVLVTSAASGRERKLRATEHKARARWERTLQAKGTNRSRGQLARLRRRLAPFPELVEVRALYESADPLQATAWAPRFGIRRVAAQGPAASRVGFPPRDVAPIRELTTSGSKRRDFLPSVRVEGYRP